MMVTGNLDYLNSISRFVPQEQAYVIVLYGTSTVICSQCNDLVYFNFQSNTCVPRCVKCLHQFETTFIPSEVLTTIFKTPNKVKYVKVDLQTIQD